MSRFGVLETPIGRVGVAAELGTVTRVVFMRERSIDTAQSLLGVPSSTARCDQLFGLLERFERYFEGEITALNSVPVAPQGTAFQRLVWEGLCRVGVGTTCSYGELARSIGRPKASRAVGAANGANPIPIVIPCHRVIGASGRLIGYSSGLDIKAWLLAHEEGGPAQPSLPLGP